MRALIEDAVASTAQLFSERNVALETHLPQSVPPVTADRDRVVQVLLNLLSNAAKFCDRQAGLIAVRAAAQADAVRVEVRDNGPGIGPEQQEIIFEKFRQGGDTLTGKPQGTGLGLPISRQIITHLGGHLWVESAPDGGATFVFTLPLSASPADSSRRPAGPVAAQARQ